MPNSLCNCSSVLSTSSAPHPLLTPLSHESESTKTGSRAPSEGPYSSRYATYRVSYTAPQYNRVRNVQNSTRAERERQRAESAGRTCDSAGILELLAASRFPSTRPRVHASTAPSTFDLQLPPSTFHPQSSPSPSPAFHVPSPTLRTPGFDVRPSSVDVTSPARGAVARRATVEAQNAVRGTKSRARTGEARAAGRAAGDLAWCSDRKAARPAQKPCQLGRTRREGGRWRHPPLVRSSPRLQSTFFLLVTLL
ncbi:hypothetical protein C8Q70DRAFT_526635 [Cubamyces menziesii]|nr:hypothetical protein C8Q70DRAFT_526635 [Cubamyces menziesii]